MNAFDHLPVITTDTTEFLHPATPKWARWIVVSLMWLCRVANALAACCSLSGFTHWAAIAKLVSLAAGIGTAVVTHCSARCCRTHSAPDRSQSTETCTRTGEPRSL
jgi:hypothetical protein